MDHPVITIRHTKFHFGHTLMVTGILGFFFLSLLLSATTTLKAAAFGAGTISNMSNQARIENGIPSLTVNGSLNAAAQAKANHMVTNGYFDHTAPDGTTGWYFVGQQGYNYSAVGENLAASNEDDSAVVNGWLNSPGHRANLLSNSFTEVGYGIAYKGEFQGYPNVTFIVALYAKPAAAPQQTPPPAATTNSQPPSSSPEAPVEQSVTDVTEKPVEEIPTPAITDEDPSPEETASAVTPEGTLSSSSFQMSQALLIILLAVCGVVFGVGLGVEFIKLHKHMTRARLHHTHHRA